MIDFDTPPVAAMNVDSPPFSTEVTMHGTTFWRLCLSPKIPANSAAA